MRLIELKCPSCGAVLQLDVDGGQAFCSHCGHQLLVDDGKVRADSRSFHDAGYAFEQGRLQAQREAGQAAPQAYYAPPQPQPDPAAVGEALRQRRITRTTRWLTVIGMLILFFASVPSSKIPWFYLAAAIGVIVFVVRSKRFNGFLRVFVIIHMVLAALIQLPRL